MLGSRINSVVKKLIHWLEQNTIPRPPGYALDVIITIDSVSISDDFLSLPYAGWLLAGAVLEV